jgi:hypothetical protein
MVNLTYGTVEFYAEQFAEILADVDASEPMYGDAIVEGFILAIDNWRNYHAKQVDEYDRVEQRVRQALTV